MTMDIKQLCEGIEMPACVTEKLEQYAKEADQEKLGTSIDKFYQRSTWEEGVKEVKEQLLKDENGLKMLACMLLAAVRSYGFYQEKGISDRIYYDTFGCFSRFVEEHKVSCGEYGFDREWWTCREIAMEEFRIGELEYEMVLREGKKEIWIHIPSDAALTRDRCRESYHAAAVFFETYYPEFAYGAMKCDSWLMAPALKEVLPEHSNILAFQKDFDIDSVDLESQDVLEWVFKLPSGAIKEPASREILAALPEHTSLQKNMKKYLLEGGKIGVAVGRLHL